MQLSLLIGALILSTKAILVVKKAVAMRIRVFFLRFFIICRRAASLAVRGRERPHSVCDEPEA
jgi:hypothetical protein